MWLEILTGISIILLYYIRKVKLRDVEKFAQDFKVVRTEQLC